MTISPKWLGAIRALLYVVGFAVLNAILVWASQATNLAPLLGTSMAGILAMLAGAAEQNLAVKSGHTTALFGSVKQA